MTAAPKPIAGARFKRAARTKLRAGYRLQERRLLLCLIAAYHDAGHDPSVRELAQRLGVPGNRHRQSRLVDRLLDQLAADGALTVERPDSAARRQHVRSTYKVNA